MPHAALRGRLARDSPFSLRPSTMGRAPVPMAGMCRWRPIDGPAEDQEHSLLVTVAPVDQLDPATS